MVNYHDHPVISAMERYGYIPEPVYREYDEDREYEERKEAQMDE